MACGVAGRQVVILRLATVLMSGVLTLLMLDTKIHVTMLTPGFSI